MSSLRISRSMLAIKFEFIWSRVSGRLQPVAARMTTMLVFFHVEERGADEVPPLPSTGKLSCKEGRHEGDEQRARFGYFLWGHMVSWVAVAFAACSRECQGVSAYLMRSYVSYLL